MSSENVDRLLAEIDRVQNKYPAISKLITELRGKIDRMSLLSVVSMKIASFAGLQAFQQPQCEGAVALSVVAGAVSTLAYLTARENAVAYDAATWRRDRLIWRFSQSLNNVLAGDVLLRQKASNIGLAYEDLNV